MNKNKIITLFILSILAATIFSPATSSSNTIQKDKNTVKLHILHYKEDGSIERTIKRLPIDKYKKFLSNMAEVVKQTTLSIKDKLEKELDILKQYNIVSPNATLEDVISYGKLDNIFTNITPPDIVMEENFQAHFALLLIVGGGFGFGLGLPGQRIINGFTSFLAAVGGLAAVVCYDWLETNTIYVLISYMLPLLIGYIAGYMGLILFAVEPGYFYSNLVMLGVAPYTLWLQLPPSS